MKFEIKFVKKDIYSLKIEDGREFEIHMAVLDSDSMWTKSEIEEETITKLLKDEAAYVLMEKAKKLSEYCFYSRKEFFNKLYKYEQDTEIRNMVLDKFEEYGIINDDSYAKRCAEYFIKTKHLSQRETKNRMTFLRGLSSETAENVICEFEDSDIENLNYLIEKKYYRYFEDSEDKKEIYKGKAALLRLGFKTCDIDNAVEDYFYSLESEE